MKKLISLLLLATLLLPVPGMGAAPEITTQYLPDAMVGVYYNTRIKADGEAPLTFAVSRATGERNDFPRALKLSTSGVLSGTPAHPGTLVFTVKVISQQGTTEKQLKLKVLPFDESQLATGGMDADIVGWSNDPITGVANGLNGGRVAMYEDRAYFLDRKGYLFQAEAPYKKAALVYKAREYGWLDTTGEMMVYFHRYLQTRAVAAPEATKGPDGYVTRIARDPIGKKGRATVMDLRVKKIDYLSVTDKIALFIQEGQMVLAELANGNNQVLRAYHEGRELQADLALPYNGHAYFRNRKDGCIYRVALDGQVATRLTQDKAETFTLAGSGKETLLYYVGAKRQVYQLPAEGGEAREVSGIRAGMLNADADYVYFTNAGDKYKVCRFAPGEDKAETLSDLAAGSIYVFDNHIAFGARKGSNLYILPKAGGEKAQKLGK